MKRKKFANPVLLLRIAAILMFVHFVGHTLGMTQGPTHGPEEAAVQETMKAHHFDTMGSSRSYWDFFLGFGFDASLNMLLQTVLLWLLARVAQRDPAVARPFIALLALVWLATILLYAKYFFAAPIIFAGILFLVLAGAWIGARSPLSSPASGLLPD